MQTYVEKLQKTVKYPLPMEKITIFDKRRVFNKAVLPGKKSIINKRMASFIPDYRVWKKM